MSSFIQSPFARKISLLLPFVGLIVVAVFFLLSTGAYTIKSGFVGVLSTFGEFSDQPKLPGLHVKIPFVQDIQIVDVKMQTVNYQQDDTLGRDGVINQAPIVVLDSKNLNIGIDLTVQFSPDPEQAKMILSKYGTNYFEKLIGPIIRDTASDVMSQYQAEDIARERSKIANHLNVAMHKNFKGLPFTLNAVQLRHIDLPKIVRAKIEEVQLAKQEEQRLMMIEKQAEKQQLIKTIEANTRLIELTTLAKAESEKKMIEAEAEAFKIEVHAKAQARANILIFKSFDEKGQIIKYKAIQKWDGKYPATLVGDKSGMILQMPATQG